MKKGLLFFVLMFLPLGSQADDSGSCGDNVTYTYVEATHTLTISGTGAMSDYQWNNKPWRDYKDDIEIVTIESGVTIIGKNAFYDCKGLSSATIPNTVTTIYAYAFEDCSALTSITIPSSVTYIAPYAFYGCESLASVTLHCNQIGDWLRAGYLGFLGPEIVTLGDEVTTINAYAFWDCSNLSSVKGGKGVKKIEWNAFDGCKNLKTIDMSEVLESIGQTAFRNCENLQSITIPSTVNEIGNGAFNGCSGLKAVTINCQEAGKWFANKESIETVVLGEGVETIADYAFNECCGIKTINLPNSLDNIGRYGFGHCSSLESITLPLGLNTVGNDAFSGCTNLKTVTVNCPVVGNWFERMESIETVILGDEVTTIADDAFERCTNLKTINLPSNLTIIGESAFSNCTNLKTINFPNNLTTIGESTFSNCTNLKTINLPSNLTTIGEYAFSNCTNLKTIDLPSKLTTIGKYAFVNTGLESIILPSSLTTIDSYAFSCPNLKQVTSKISPPFTTSAFNWSNTVLIVPHGTKSDYKSVSGWKEAVIFEEGETVYDMNINDEQGIKYSLKQDKDYKVYYDVTGHTDVLSTELTIPGLINDCQVREVQWNAFKDCTTLKRVTFEEGLTEISFVAFEGCIALKEYVSLIQDPSNVSAGPVPEEVSKRAHLVVPKGTRGEYLSKSFWYDFIIFEQGEPIVEYEKTPIDDQGLTYMFGQAAESFYYKLTGYTDAVSSEIIIPEKLNGLPVKDACYNAFENCTNLKRISIPDNFIMSEFYGWGTFFRGCFGLTVVLNQKKIEGWGGEDFLEAVELGENVDTLGSNVFSSCKNLTRVSFPEKMDSIADGAFYNCTGLQSINLPQGLVYISGGTFNGCMNLKEVTIPEGVNQIGPSAFLDCTALESISFPKSLQTIGSSAFSGCSGLTSVTIPNSVTSIGNGAFRGCSGLTSVTIPNSVTSIGDYAFYGCSGLTSVKVPVTDFSSFFQNKIISLIKDHIGKPVQLIDNEGKDITNFIVPDDVTSIGGYAFYNCSSLTSVTIPNSVTSIGESAFRGCSGLTSVTIPNSVTSIGGYAFEGCTGLQTIITYIEEPFSTSAFSEEMRSTVTLRVPFLKSKIYRDRGGWNFTNIVEMDGTPEEMALISFADPVAKQACVSKWDVNGDGEICMGEAKLVTDTKELFYNISNKAELVSFDEIVYFTNLTSIGDYTFSGCTGLKSISIPSGVTAIGASAFSGCTKLGTIELPVGLLTIDSYAFYNCSSLKSINLSEGLTSMGGNVFKGSGLNTMTIPLTVTSIGDYALAGNIIYCNLTTPISVGTLMSNASETILHVPEGCEEAFRQAYGWNQFLIAGTGSDITDWSVGEVTAVVEEPGELRLALVELDEEEIKRLKILGKLNSEDIKLLMEGAGKIANIESLDLSGVTFDYDGGCYYSKSGMYGDIWGYYYEEQYYLTEEDYVTHPSNGPFSHTSTTAYHSPYLAAVFMGKDYKHIVMPKNFKKVARKVFFNCKNLQSVEYPGGIDYVDEYAFAGCSILQTVTLAGTDTICDGAFSGCTMLQNVENISRVKSIGESAFRDCKMFIGDNGVLQLLQVDSIPSNAFNNCKMLSDVRLSDRLYFIGNNAFQGCSSLPSITLPNSLKSLSSGAFSECSTLENVTYSPDLMELDYTCFRNTPFMDNLPVVGGIIYMGNIALSYAANSNVAETSPATLTFREGTTYIADVFIESLNVEYGKDYRRNVTQLNLPSTLLKIGKNAFSGSSITSLTLPNAIKEIGEWAFNDSKIAKLTLPEDISNIGDYAFANTAISSLTYDLTEVSGKNIFRSCKSLEKVTLGTKVQLLPDYIFEGCSALTVVKSEERTNGTHMDIGTGAFSGCNNLAKLTLPEDMVYIGDNAFSDCSSLKSFSTSESLETIGGSAFSGCRGLTSFTLNEGLKTIGDEAFNGCNNVAEYKLPESLDSLGNYAFQYCTLLTELTLPANITRLGYGFVRGCDNIIKLVSHIKEPPYNGPGQYNNRAGEILYVPDGCKPLYRNANDWKNFENIEELSGNDVTARNKLKVADSEVVSGKSTTLSVELTNDINDFVAYQFDLIVPKGLSIPESASGNLDVTIGNRYSNSGQSVRVKKLAVNQYSKVNKYRFVYISLTNSITGTGGPLLTLNLQAANSLSAGNRKASLENIIFTQSNGTENVLDKVKFDILVNVTGLLLGDANDDKKVTITDAVEVARYILGNQPEKFNKAAADTNGDGIINVSDILGIINIILKQSGRYSSRAYSLSSVMKMAAE